MNKNVRSLSLSRRVLNWHAAIKLLRASAKVVSTVSPRVILTGSVTAAACAIAASPVSAQTNYYWDGGTTNIATNGDGASAGGNGTWSTAIANWDVGSGVPHSVWVNGNTANFGGTSGTVTLGTAITAANIVINPSSGGYTLATGGFQLTLTGGVTATTAAVNFINGAGTLALTGGGTHTFTLTGSALNIVSGITGSDAITLAGGNLGFSGANTGYTGKVTVNGTGSNTTQLFLNSDLSLGAVPAANVADSLTLNGGTVIAGVVTGTAINYFNANPILSANRGITLGANGGTFTIGYGSAGFLTINGVISGGGTLIKNDSGTLFLNGTNTNTGATNVNGGTLQLGTGGTTGSLTGTSGIVISNNNGGTLAVNRSDALAFTAPISGAGGFSQIGQGTTTLSLANTYTGTTLVSGGTLNLDYNAAGAAASGAILSSSSALRVAGGTFNVNGNASTASSQTLASLTVGAGAGTVSTSSPGAAATSLVFTSGTITRANANGPAVAIGTVNFAPGANSSIKVGTAANAFLGTSDFYNNSAYAATDATGIVVAAAQTNSAVNGFTSAATNYGNTTSGATDTQTTAAATGNSVVFTGGSSKVIDIGATASNANTLTLNGFVNTGGALTIQDSGAGATGGLTIGTNKELIIGGNSNVTISAPIKNNAAGASGVTLSNTGTVTLSGTNTYTGPTTVNSGTVNINGSGAQTSGALYVSLGGNSGVLNLSPTGTLGLGSGNIIVGATAASTGVINLSSGAISTTGQMNLGSFNGGYGVLNMSGGSLSLNGVRNGGGNNGSSNSFGNSYFNITGSSTVTSTDNTVIGRVGIGTNIFQLNGANAVYNATAFFVAYDGGGYSVATVGAGTLNASNTITLNNQSSIAGSVGIFNLNGGLVSSGGGITAGTGGTTVLNFNGGTLQAKGTGTTISGLSNANIYSGGLTYDTSTFANTVSQPLLTTGGTTGVSSIALASNGTGYVAAPVVNITGGGGTGASAVAVYDPVTGTVTGITITSAGTGYTSAPTVTLIGGGGTTAATLGTIATGSNGTTDGGLTKIGTGTLTLTGASTYLGTTVVNNGTLAATSLQANGTPSSIGAGTAVTLNGGTLRYAGSGDTGNANGGGFNRTITVGANGGTVDSAGTGYLGFSGSFAGSGTLTLSGSNQFLYSGTSAANFTGNIIVGNGTASNGFVQYRSSNANAFGSGSITVNTGGTFTADSGATTPSTLGNAFTLNGGLLSTQAPNMTYSGPISVPVTSTVGHTPNSNGAGTITLSNVVSGVGGLNVGADNSATTVTLQGANTYQGATTVAFGTLSLDNNNSTTARVVNSSGITVNGGGTLLLAQSGATASTDRIGNAVPVTLATSATANGGGKFSTGGLSEGPANGVSGQSAAMGALTLGNNSTIDFTTGATAAGSNLLFASLSYTPGNVVSIRNFTGAAGSDDGTAGNDRLLFTTDPGLSDAQLASITFYNDAGTAFATGATEISFNGYTELVPVPEPATWAGAILMVGTLGFVRRRQIAGWVGRARA